MQARKKLIHKAPYVPLLCVVGLTANQGVARKDVACIKTRVVTQNIDDAANQQTGRAAPSEIHKTS
jgi:hypothetical protein